MLFSLIYFTLAYVTYQDIRKISGLKDQTVIVVRAPPETRLEVPDPVEVRVLFWDTAEWLMGQLPENLSLFIGNALNEKCSESKIYSIRTLKPPYKTAAVPCWPYTVS